MGPEYEVSVLMNTQKRTASFCKQPYSDWSEAKLWALPLMPLRAVGGRGSRRERLAWGRAGPRNQPKGDESGCYCRTE